MNDANDPRNPCNDNDELLFNGLLCAGRDPRGCAAVVASQDPNTGQMYRNPQYRIRNMRDPANGGDFSPDMALGVQIYALTTGDHDRFFRWLQWLDLINGCGTEVFGRCIDFTPPLFCPNNRNCTIRPGDAATLARTVEHLEATYGMRGLDQLPNGRLRGYLGTWKNWGEQMNFWGSIVASCGYSQHIGYTVALIHRLTGSNLLDPAARGQSNNPCNVTTDARGARIGNAFFDMMGGHPRQQIVSDILYACPSEATDRRELPSTWHWENEITDASFRRPNLWGCIFAAATIGIMPAAREEKPPQVQE
ncbi:hypothetical protein NF552_22685 (plasmid) [Roseomonas mucosa]|nr:hypothetical protein NF552_22685 [Roseomonas mucosa]